MVKYIYFICLVFWDKIIRFGNEFDRIWVFLWFCMFVMGCRGGFVFVLLVSGGWGYVVVVFFGYVINIK